MSDLLNNIKNDADGNFAEKALGKNKKKVVGAQAEDVMSKLLTKKVPKKIQVPSYLDEQTVLDLDAWCMKMTFENRKIEPTSKPISRAGAIEAIVQQFLENNK